MMPLVATALATALAWTAAARADDPPVPLPRIAVADSRFVVADTGEPFVPRGFHYIRLQEDGVHYVHTPGLYDPDAAETMLADLESRGFNLVRVFLGMRGVGGKDGLSDAFVANLVDFLRRATAHGVYVLPVRTFLPEHARYQDIANRGVEAPPGQPAPGFNNQRYFSPAWREAKALFWRDLIDAIRGADARLLSTVFAWELENESAFHTDEPPFSLTEGAWRWNGATYDLANPADRARLAEEAAVSWATHQAEVIRQADPDALVSASVFTWRAVGRQAGPPMPGEAPDPRSPLPPVALARSGISYVDVHFYPGSDEMLEADLQSIRFDELRRTALEYDKALFIGEIGGLRAHYDDPRAVAQKMPVYLGRLGGLGFRGYCYWTYDTVEQPTTWAATAGGNAVLEALTRMGEGAFAWAKATDRSP